MTTGEERLQILRMLDSGQITVDQAARLLEALDSPEREESENGSQANWVRVRVTDTRTGRSKVNVNIPMSLVNLGLKVGARFAPDIEDLDPQKMVSAIRSGAQGKIADIEDEESGERVEIFVE